MAASKREAMGKRVKITKTVVDNLLVDSIVWDSECTGFHVRRQKGEAKVYSVFYRTRDGRQRFCKVGRHGSPWTSDEARKRAREILVDVANGKDPAGDRYEDRKAETVSELCDLYLVEAAAGRILKRGRAKKASTLLTDKSRVEHVKRLLGHLKVASVTNRDVERLRDAVSAGTATRTLGMLGAIFQFSIKRGMRTDNPVHRVERPADGERTRRMSEDEYARLGEALRALSATMWTPAVAAAHFLCLSGWRSGEALGLKWSEVDLVTRTAQLLDTKTGKSTRALSHAACDVLRALPRMGGDLAFPSSRGSDQPMRGRGVWDALARHANLPSDVTPHTMRHSFASVAADLGYSELTIAVLLGHKKASITSRYTHHSDPVLLSAADAVAKRIEEMLGFEAPSGVVVEADFQRRA
jgi:integrase